jgi:putative SOS response-associated peptidase YedK
MCGRIRTPPTKDILKVFDLTYQGDYNGVNINVAPTDMVPVIDTQKPQELQYKSWSLVPWYSKTGKADHKRPTFNARYDRLLDPQSMWSKLVGKKHCVVITNGYYEWEWLDEKGKKKQPHFIRTKGEDFTLLAKLWDEWVNKETGEVIASCSVITHDAVESMGKIHDRMPAFLTRQGSDIWLNNELPLSERLKVIEPVGEGFLESIKIKTVGDMEEFEHVVFK